MSVRQHGKITSLGAPIGRYFIRSGMKALPLGAVLDTTGYTAVERQEPNTGSRFVTAYMPC